MHRAQRRARLPLAAHAGGRAGDRDRAQPGSARPSASRVSSSTRARDARPDPAAGTACRSAALAFALDGLAAALPRPDPARSPRSDRSTARATGASGEHRDERPQAASLLGDHDRVDDGGRPGPRRDPVPDRVGADGARRLLPDRHRGGARRGAAGVVDLPGRDARGHALPARLFALLGHAQGSFALWPSLRERGSAAGSRRPSSRSASPASGSRRASMPLHVWLPGAHANAPSHVSALMSGVLIKMGIYGIVRVVRPAARSARLVGRRAARARGGVGRARHRLRHRPARPQAAARLQQHREHRHHRDRPRAGRRSAARSGAPISWSLGLGGRAAPRAEPRLFKSLLFLAAGSVLHATGTRRIDRARRPGADDAAHASCSSSLGAVAICGLPPLNGFVSELLLYLGLLRAARRRLRRGMGLGEPRGARARDDRRARRRLLRQGRGRRLLRRRPAARAAADAHDPGRGMLAPMVALARRLRRARPVAGRSRCRCSQRAVAAWDPALGGAAPALSELAPLGWVSAAGRRPGRRGRARRGALRAAAVRGRPPARTWDCGYARPTPRMQYTASSFAETLVGLFAWAAAIAADASRGCRARSRRGRASRARCPSRARSAPCCRCWRAVDRGFVAAAARSSGAACRRTCSTSCWPSWPCCWSRDDGRVATGTAMRRSTSTLLVTSRAAARCRRCCSGVINKTKAWFAGRRGPAAAPALLRPRSAVAQGHGPQPDHDLGVPRRARGQRWSPRCWRRCWFRFGAFDAPIAFTGDLILFAYLFGARRASSRPRRRSTPARPSRAWAPRARSTFACLAEPALFLAFAGAGPALGLAQPVADAPRADDRRRSTACRPPRCCWSRVGAVHRAARRELPHPVRRSEHAPRADDDPRGHGARPQRAALRADPLRRGGEAVRCCRRCCCTSSLPFTLGDRAGSTGRCSSPACCGVAVAIGVVESVMARLRLRHVPPLLIAACLLCALRLRPPLA